MILTALFIYFFSVQVLKKLLWLSANKGLATPCSKLKVRKLRIISTHFLKPEQGAEAPCSGHGQKCAVAKYAKTTLYSAKGDLHKIYFK